MCPYKYMKRWRNLVEISSSNLEILTEWEYSTHGLTKALYSKQNILVNEISFNGSRYILRRPCRHCRPVIKTSVDGLYSYNMYTKNLCKRTVFYFNLSSKTWSYNFTMCICGDCLCQRNIG